MHTYFYQAYHLPQCGEIFFKHFILSKKCDAIYICVFFGMLSIENGGMRVLVPMHPRAACCPHEATKRRITAVKICG